MRWRLLLLLLLASVHGALASGLDGSPAVIYSAELLRERCDAQSRAGHELPQEESQQTQLRSQQPQQSREKKREPLMVLSPDEFKKKLLGDAPFGGDAEDDHHQQQQESVGAGEEERVNHDPNETTKKKEEEFDSSGRERKEKEFEVCEDEKISLEGESYVCVTEEQENGKPESGSVSGIEKKEFSANLSTDQSILEGKSGDESSDGHFDEVKAAGENESHERGAPVSKGVGSVPDDEAAVDGGSEESMSEEQRQRADDEQEAAMLEEEDEEGDTNEDDFDTDEVLEESEQERFNYASLDAGAIALASNKEMDGKTSLLIQNRDQYALTPCSVSKWVTISLSEELRPDTIELSNWERYSSTIREFEVYGANEYPTTDWTLLGSYGAAAKSEIGSQKFEIQNQAWIRFVKLRWLSHYGDEFYCTMTEIRVFGSTDKLLDVHKSMESKDSQTKQLKRNIEGAEIKDSNDEDGEVEAGVEDLQQPPGDADSGAVTSVSNNSEDMTAGFEHFNDGAVQAPENVSAAPKQEMDAIVIQISEDSRSPRFPNGQLLTALHFSKLNGESGSEFPEDSIRSFRVLNKLYASNETKCLQDEFPVPRMNTAEEEAPLLCANYTVVTLPANESVAEVASEDSDPLRIIDEILVLNADAPKDEFEEVFVWDHCPESYDKIGIFNVSKIEDDEENSSGILFCVHYGFYRSLKKGIGYLRVKGSKKETSSLSQCVNLAKAEISLCVGFQEEPFVPRIHYDSSSSVGEDGDSESLTKGTTANVNVTVNGSAPEDQNGMLGSNNSSSPASSPAAGKKKGSASSKTSLETIFESLTDKIMELEIDQSLFKKYLEEANSRYAAAMNGLHGDLEAAEASQAATEKKVELLIEQVAELREMLGSSRGARRDIEDLKDVVYDIQQRNKGMDAVLADIVLGVFVALFATIFVATIFILRMFCGLRQTEVIYRLL